MRYGWMVLCLAAGLSLRAGEVRVWVPDPAALIGTNTPPAEGSAAVTMTCPRGGAVSAQVVISAGAPRAAAAAVASELAGPGGARIGRERVQVRYGTRRRDLAGGDYDFGADDTFDLLAESFVPGEAIQPVWVTVRVPGDAVPGVYTGTLSIEAAGARQTVPLTVTVAAFTLKTPGERAFLHSVQVSQESLSLRYGVAPYSEEHFRLLERQVALMGELGNNVLYVPFIGKVHVGNDCGLVHVRREGEGYAPEFTAFDRYFALYRKYCGVPRSVTVILTARFMNNRAQTNDTTETVWLTVRSPDGTLTPTAVRAYPANEPLWKGLVDGLQARLKAAGAPDGTLRLGDLLDREATKAQLEFFARIAPGVTWSSFLHGYGGGAPGPGGWMLNGTPLSYGEYPDAYKTAQDPQPVRRKWNSPYLTLCTMRGWHSDIGPQSNPFTYRCLPEIALGANNNSVGLARLGMDYWVLPPGSFGNAKAQSIFGRYQADGKIGRLYRGDTRRLTAPGPNGPLTLQRFEMLREGVQEAEARCAIEQALADPARAAAMGNDLKRRCEELLVERIVAIRPPAPGTFANDGRWPERSARLYTLAGAVVGQPVP